MAGKSYQPFCMARCFEWSTDLYSPNKMSPIFCFLNTDMRLLLTADNDERYSLTLRSVEIISGISFSYKVFIQYQNGKSQDILLSSEGIAKATLIKSVLLLKFHERNIKRKLIDFSPRMTLTFMFIAYEELNARKGSLLQSILLPSCSEERIYYEAFSRDISKLLDEDSNYDVEITCDDETFHAHKVILSCRSKVFAAMLQSNMVEGITGKVMLQDIKATAFRLLLRYLYSGMMPKFDVDIAKELYEIGDRYAVEELKDACSQFLRNNLSQDNSYEILVLADRHGDYSLRSHIIAYIVDNRMPLHHGSWPDFCESQPQLANRVLNLCIQWFSK